MFNYRIRNNFVIRAIAVFLIYLLVLPDPGLAATRKNIFEKKGPGAQAMPKDTTQGKKTKAAKLTKKAQPKPPTDPSQIIIPDDKGTLLETYKAKEPGKLIIHIQDAHCNYSAQKNLAEILEGLVNQFGLKLILVEGGSGDASLSFLWEYGTQDARKKVAEKYLKEGKISGEEYLDIVSEYPLLLWGIEENKLYEDNTAAFFAIDSVRDGCVSYLTTLEQAVEALKPKVYSKEILEFEEKLKVFDEEKIAVNEHYRYLVDKASQLGNRSKINLTKDYPCLSSFITASQLEQRIDFQLAEKQREQILDKLSRTLPKGQLSALLSKSKDFKDYEYTYLERDLADLSRLDDLEPFRKFQRLAALRSGKLLSYSELARDASISVDTSRRYLEYLATSYQVLLVQPYYQNITSSVVKTPKIYWLDVGLMRQLCGFRGDGIGDIYETMVMAEIVKWIKTMQRNAELYFYRTRSGLELDIMLKTETGIIGMEIKARKDITSADTRPMRHIAERLGKKWRGGIVIYRGDVVKKLSQPHIWAVPSHRLFTT